MRIVVLSERRESKDLSPTLYTERVKSAASSISSAPVYPERSRGAPTA